MAALFTWKELFKLKPLQMLSGPAVTSHYRLRLFIYSHWLTKGTQTHFPPFGKHANWVSWFCSGGLLLPSGPPEEFLHGSNYDMMGVRVVLVGTKWMCLASSYFTFSFMLPDKGRMLLWPKSKSTGYVLGVKIIQHNYAFIFFVMPHRIMGNVVWSHMPWTG